ncbi:MAG: class I SAM-dependent methyltransferase [Planctomycetota bacterium]
MNRPADQRFWDDYARIYVKLQLSPVYQDLLAQTIAWTEVEAGDHCLDLGCGPGNYAAKMYEAGGHVLAIDYSRAMLAHAKALFDGLPRRGDSQGPALELLEENVVDFLGGVADATYDVVLASLFLAYVRDPGHVACEIFRILKPGGRFVMSNPMPEARFFRIFLKSGWAAFRHLLSAIKLLRYSREFKRRARTGEFHFFSETETRALLEEAGFRARDIEIASAFADTAWLARARR